MARQAPTEDEFNDWFTPDDVLEGLGDRYEGTVRKREVMELLKAGLAVAVARHGQPDSRKTASEAFVEIPQSLWNKWDDIGDHHFWETGQAIFEVHHSDSTGYGGYTHTYRFFDVRFDPDCFPDMAAASQPKVLSYGLDEVEDRALVKSAADAEEPRDLGGAEPLPSPRRRVGRPSKEYWEELLVEIMRQIWRGDLKPRRQADVQHAMAEWIVEQGYPEPKLTQLKARARLIFQVYESEHE